MKQLLELEVLMILVILFSRKGNLKSFIDLGRMISVESDIDSFI